MKERPPDILLLRRRIAPAELDRLVQAHFGDMVKYVVDIRRGVIAIGGGLHAEAEQALLDDGSEQDDLWGANYFPAKGREECVQFTSLINIRPARGNRGMFIEDAGIREQVRGLTFDLVGAGERA